MISSIENLVESIDQKDRVINYLKTMYKEKTGEEPIIPDPSTDNPSMPTEPDEQVDAVPNAKFQFFKDKVNSLNLPSANDKDAKNRIEKLRRKKDTSVLIQKLDLSHFAHKEVSHELLKRVIEGLKILKSVEMLNLSHNDLNDSYIDIIIEFLLLPKLSKIDLSFNKLSPGCIKKLNNTIKAAKNLQYLDVSYNPFNNDEYSCLTLCSCMKSCEKLIHFGICDSSRDSGIRVLSMRPGLQSLNLEDSRYKKKTWDFFTRYLSNKKYELAVLSLKFCHIDFIYGAQFLAKGLSKNRTLISLNLYGTSLCDVSGKLIIESLINHKVMKELDLGGNYLSTQSCIALGKMLKLNKVINSINLSKNYNLVNENFAYVIEGLVENQTLMSLGDLLDTKIGVKFRESTEKLLIINKKFGDWRDADTLKSQKVDFYMSNVMSENTLKRKEDININNNESILLKSTSSLKTSTNFNRDINTVIAPLSPNKTSYNKFISNENIEETTINMKPLPQGGKIVVPFSIPNTNYLKQGVKKTEQKSTSKSKPGSSTRKRTTSTSPRRKVSPKGKTATMNIPKHSILNTIASFTQEVINNNPQFFEVPKEDSKYKLQGEQRRIQFKNGIPYSEKATGPNIPDDANLTNLDKKSVDDIITKYNIGIKNKRGYEEQAIFGTYIN